jgi:DNA modification methylase
MSELSGLQIVYRSPEELLPDPRNPRRHDKRQLKQLAKSIKAFGFAAPILTGLDDRVVAGHGRLEAAKLLKIPSVPTISLSHLSDQQLQAYMVTDNRLTDLSSWDRPKLTEILLELAQADLSFDLDAVGFSVAEIDLLVADEGTDEEDSLPEPPIEQEAISRPGDIWILEDHRVLCGDALLAESFTSLMGGDQADLVFTDPPYNVPINGHVSGMGKTRHREFAQGVGELSEDGFIAFLEAALGNAVRCSRDGALQTVAMDWRHYPELLAAARTIYDEQINLCVWSKTNAGMGSLYRSQHELFGVWRKGKARHRNNVELGRFGRSRSNVWTFPGANSFGMASDEGRLLALHPTVKPVALIAEAILDSTRRGDIVLDPFLGSGSTLIAADKVGRRCRGIELDPLYVDTIIQRWQRWSGAGARRQADGALFDDLATAGGVDA